MEHRSDISRLIGVFIENYGHAIDQAHINVNQDDGPELYKSMSRDEFELILDEAYSFNQAYGEAQAIKQIVGGPNADKHNARRI